MGGRDSSTSGCGATKRKRRFSRISQTVSSLPGPFVHHSKRSSASTKTTTITTTAARESKPMMNSTTSGIDDLPDVLLIDILSRLPCFELLSKCKPVCKRWRYLISDTYLISSFLIRQVQGGNIQVPPIPPPLTLINQKGENFPNPSPGPKFLTRLFKRLMSSLPLEKEPVVVGAFNDLVLCCTTEYYQRNYFICNSYTTEWVAIPLPPQVLHDVLVGFICDPYYNFHKEQRKKDDVQQQRKHSHRGQLKCSVNVEYRCKVVRILPCDDTILPYDKCRFKVEIFSSEVGEWRESTISFPREFWLSHVNSSVHFAHNGMLYWLSNGGFPGFLIGVDPFMISCETTSCSTDISGTTSSSPISNGNSLDDGKCYECRYIELVIPKCVNIELYLPYHMQCLSVPGGGGGCLQICALDYTSDDKSILVWELKEEGDLIIEADGARKLCARKDVLHLEDFGSEVQLIGFDPNEEGYLYVDYNEEALVAKIDLGSGSSLACEAIDAISNCLFFPLQVEPWWPTPVYDPCKPGSQIPRISSSSSSIAHKKGLCNL